MIITDNEFKWFYKFIQSNTTLSFWQSPNVTTKTSITFMRRKATFPRPISSKRAPVILFKTNIPSSAFRRTCPCTTFVHNLPSVMIKRTPALTFSLISTFWLRTVLLSDTTSKDVFSRWIFMAIRRFLIWMGTSLIS